MKDSSTATERVGRYQLLEPIGSGPNGVVSRAKVFGVAGFERQFAVKRFLAELTAGPSAQSLSQAARSYGSLEHPRIARMSEFGVAQGQTFTAVELVNGLDVFRLMQECKLAAVAIPPGGALALVSQAARAVGYAHGRGLSHLGLSPTNVIVTADGDVKVTDFGILAATMPAKPVESPRLAQRIPYMAPEQLAGEATSAATDVFVLGVLAYELVTGQRAFRGDYPAAVAQAILAGPPAEPPLPRPIVRVLQRCLARSPFERFPDARALADALDAALRVAPVPGTRKDIGAQIKATIDRYATLNEGNLSGMVALNLGGAAALGSPSEGDTATTPFMRTEDRPPLRPEARTEPSAMPIIPAATTRDMRPFSTVPGLAPPPIPVPPGVTPPPSSGLAQPGGDPKTTMLGVSAAKKPQIPSIVPQIKKPGGPAAGPNVPTSPLPSLARPAPPATPPRPPTRLPTEDAIDDAVDEPSGLIEVDDSGPIKLPRTPTELEEDDATMERDPNTMQGVTPHSVASLHAGATARTLPRTPRPTPGQTFESTTGEMSTAMLESLNRKATMSTSELQPQSRPSAPEIEVVRPASMSDAAIELPPAEAPVLEDPVAEFHEDAHRVAADLEPSPSSTMPGHAPAVSYTSAPRIASSPGISQPQAPAVQPARKSRVPMVLLTLVLVGALGASGYYLYTTFMNKPATPVATAKHDAGTTAPIATKTIDANSTGSAVAVATTTVDAAAELTATPDAAAVATTPVDAAAQVAAATPDAGPDKSGTDNQVATPTGASDQLQISSKPAGAHVFIDGADQGTTPMKMPGSSDRHTLAVMLPGHDLYIAEVDGHGVFDVELKPITKQKGYGGIKVLKCKKDRYYIYVDGNPTGQTCPSERINTVVGHHTVEIYDIVTETRRKFEITVKDEGASERIRLE